MCNKNIKSFNTFDVKNYVSDLENFFQVMSRQLTEESRTGKFGCYLTDEELAKELQSNYWKDDWSNDYRDKEGNLTDEFFEDVNEDYQFVMCDGCKKWGSTGMNYNFEADFYCDMCVVNDIQKDQYKIDLSNNNYNSEYSKDWEKNIDDLIVYLQEYKETEREKSKESDKEFYQFMSNKYGKSWNDYAKKKERHLNQEKS